MKTRIFAFLTVLLCFSLLLVGCSGKKEPSQDRTTESQNGTQNGSQTESGTSEPVTPARSWEDLPRTDYRRQEYLSILGRQANPWSALDLTVSGEPTTQLDSAIFSRNSAVEARHNIRIRSTLQGDKVLENTLAQQALNGANDYDLYDLPLTTWGEAVLNGYATDLNRINLLDMSESWWDENFVENMTLYDQLYGVVGDATYMDKLATWAVIFNVDMPETYGLEENPYDLVDNMEWTLEVMRMMAKAVNTDNGEPGIKMEEGDVYGICGETFNTFVLFEGCGMPITSMREDGLSLNILSQKEQGRQIFESVFELVAGSTLTYNADSSGASTSTRHKIGRDFFINQQALFFISSLNNLPTYFKNSDSDYGILPIPMRDTDQDGYHCGISNYGCMVFAIPSNARNVEMSATLLQALSCRGETAVNPTFYNVVLKNGTMRDPDSARMLDVIFANRTYDVGLAYSLEKIINIGGLVTNNRQDQYISTVDGAEGAANDAIEKVISFYERNLAGRE